jgi:hypothetical protein
MRGVCVCALFLEWKTNCSVPIVLCAASGSRRMGNIWLRAVTVRRRYMTRKRVKKLGEYFRFLLSLLVIFCPYLDHFLHFILMTYMFTQLFFSHTSVFWQTTLLENRVTCISEVFVSVLMASIWLLERKISRSEYVSSLPSLGLSLEVVLNSLHTTSFFA